MESGASPVSLRVAAGEDTRVPSLPALSVGNKMNGGSSAHTMETRTESEGAGAKLCRVQAAVHVGQFVRNCVGTGLNRGGERLGQRLACVVDTFGNWELSEGRASVILMSFGAAPPPTTHHQTGQILRTRPYLAASPTRPV